MKQDKKRQIRDHLLNGESLTGLQALELYGSYRLSSTINRLRNEGLPIETIMIKRDDSTSYAKYLIPIHERRKDAKT